MENWGSGSERERWREMGAEKEREALTQVFGDHARFPGVLPSGTGSPCREWPALPWRRQPFRRADRALGQVPSRWGACLVRTPPAAFGCCSTSLPVVTQDDA